MNAILLILTLLPTQTPEEKAVLEVFKTKCIACHGPDVTKPKGKFGYILDLKKLAQADKLIKPGKPDESKLWKLVKSEDMPPDDSKDGTLSQEQKDTIRKWIESLSESSSQVSLGTSQVSKGAVGRSFEWLGKFHLLTLHFPIVLILLSGFCRALELITSATIWTVSNNRDLADLFMIWGAVFIIPVYSLGWLLSLTGLGSSESDALLFHKVFATVTVFMVCLTAYFCYLDLNEKSRHTTILILVSCLLVTITAHFGAMMVHGSDFLNW